MILLVVVLHDISSNNEKTGISVFIFIVYLIFYWFDYRKSNSLIVNKRWLGGFIVRLSIICSLFLKRFIKWSTNYYILLFDAISLLRFVICLAIWIDSWICHFVFEYIIIIYNLIRLWLFIFASKSFYQYCIYSKNRGIDFVCNSANEYE